ncbi:HD domain-containing protein [Dysgonomonas sp. 511]|uniref:HD domain-containing protein n=1 Tax=Dysgonomonas sp. 511 TaxID=2302930 RepID=UPI0013D7498E|nr:HD domain-containing protein [Dysgonomonas sp. 511]NDV77757.1 HD domain-containing protein [Dysgonomonas sp. 511]
MAERKKIINDPVFGFITIPNTFLYNLIQHPVVQRLQQIKQLGLASFVYPGAQHTRLHHSIGAMYLMSEAINNLRARGHEITPEEANGAMACILLHDVGHGPFSHVLEYTLMHGVRHERLSLAIMQMLNEEMKGALDISISIFKDEYPKRFLHQLVSGQLDVDRLDYLRRDSFFTGVTEGNIGSARIIKMLDLKNDRLVVEAKGIYSIENFLMARRLMYWQVYLHKTAVAAEKMMISTFRRAKYLVQKGEKLFASPSLLYFLEKNVDAVFFEENKQEVLQHFVNLDDNDIWCALKVWIDHEDVVLSKLSSCLINRKLFKIEISNAPLPAEKMDGYIKNYMHEFSITEEEASYFCSSDIVYTNMYSEVDDSIDILYNDGTIKDISEASDMLNIQLLSKKVEKYYFTYMRL